MLSQKTRNYLPFYAQKEAKELSKAFDNKNVFCGKLAQIEPEEILQSFENTREKFFFYDIILPERNLHYPSYFLHSLYAKKILGNAKYNEYIQKGALFGILYKQNFNIQSINFHFGGAFASLIATKCKM